MFYLSPALKSAQFKKLKKALIAYMDALKLMWTAGENAANASDVKDGQKTVRQSPAPVVFDKNGGVEWVELSQSEGRVCAKVCGLFPPCMPLILDGEAITEKKIKLMLRADHLFGIEDGKICVYKK